MAKKFFELDPERQGERVLLVGVGQKSGRGGSVENSLEELAHLAHTAGATVVEKVFQRRNRMDPATFVGKGKAVELKETSDALNIDALIFDDDLTPTQGRNLEEITGRKVIDRSELILDIFAQHARTKEANIEVELAQLYYRLPRLVGEGIALSRLGGGIGTRGPGEQKLEVDRRRIRARIGHLKKELKEIEKSKAVQRKGRENLFRIALVGYTNSGKTTLMNRLTQAHLKVEEGFFSTLDSTTRKLKFGIRPESPESSSGSGSEFRTPNSALNHVGFRAGVNPSVVHTALPIPDFQRVLITDTVGFIRKLPHHLITSFHSTLQEAVEADLRLLLVDGSHPDAIGQMETALKILGDLGCMGKPLLYVFNKIDRSDSSAIEKFLASHHPSCAISALHGEGIEGLLERVKKEMESFFVEREILIPPDKMWILSRIYQLGEVLERGWFNGKVKVKVLLRKEHWSGVMKSLEVKKGLDKI